MFRQHGQHHQAQQHHRRAFEQEHPLPAAQPTGVVHEGQDGPGHRPADHPGQRHGNGEQRGHLGAAPGRVPAVEVDQDAREEPGLGRAQGKAQQVEGAAAFDQQHAGRQQPPHHHQAGDPAAWADPVEHQVARHAEQRVGNEEQPGTQAIDRVGQLQVLAHLHLGKADVDAVQVGEQVAHQQQRHQPPGDCSVGTVGPVNARLAR
ncbi:hypothetical protein D3C76_954600 [compost metagenome]